MRSGLIVEILEILGGAIVIVLAGLRIWSSIRSRSRLARGHVVDQQRK